MNYYKEIKENLLKSEIYDKVKDYAKDRNKVQVYYNTGKLLSEDGKEYGKNIIKQYSEKLMTEVGKKYNERTLRRIRQFYEMFSIENGPHCGPIWNTMYSKLTWSHYRELLAIKNIAEIKYYLNECEKNNLTQRQLHELIKSNAYDRLNSETKNKLINQEKLELPDLVPNPIVVYINEDTDKRLTKYKLKQAILTYLDDFLRQLGEGFTYV